MLLSLSSCDPEEYTCDDGGCIVLSKRCDGRSDCQDDSDEHRCKTVNILETYDKFLSPLNELTDNVSVNITLNISYVGSFNEISSCFETEFTLTLSWTDSRLSFDNLQEAQQDNIINPKEMTEIWIPKIVFKNTKNREESTVDDRTKVTIKKLKRGYISDKSYPENKFIYDGKDNVLEYSHYYYMIFHCDFLMQWYPFDTQVCKIEIEPKQGYHDQTELFLQDFGYTGSLELQQYIFKDTKCVKDGKKIEIRLYFGRRLLSIFLTDIVPTLILICISHTANYFKDSFFEARISLNVTVMLVITTMFINISNNLPKTSYMKMMDGWLLFNLSKPFIDIILQTYMEHLRNDDNDRVINKHGREQTLNDDKGINVSLIKVTPTSSSTPTYDRK